MHSAPDLRERFLEISALESKARWLPFEALLATLFKRGHFRIERQSKAAGPRQLDLVASRRGSAYLVEAKWKARPLAVGDIDGLYARLEGTSPTTIGVLISPSGFARGLVREVIRRKSRPVLLLGPNELLDALEDPSGLGHMLGRKLDHFLVTGEVLVGPNAAEFGGPSRSTWGHQPYFVATDGTPVPWVSCDGGYGNFLFALELADVDWVPAGGKGVCLDFQPAIYDQAALTSLISELIEVGWLSVGATWAIEQFDTNWHGLGCPSFVEAMQRWHERYESLDHVHHTEQFCITDSLDERLFALSGDVSADDERECGILNLSLHLSGIPLEPAPFEHLAQIVGDDGPIYYRPLARKSVSAMGMRGRQSDLSEPLAYVVESDLEDVRYPRWVSGLVIKNPFRGVTPEGVEELDWPSGVRDSEVVVCSLGQWHPWDEVPESYELRRAEWADTTEFSVIRFVVQWQGELRPRGTDASDRY
jgi:hypothetical protein